MNKRTIELWRDGELERTFDCTVIHRKKDGTCTITLPASHTELTTGDELRFDCDSLIELMK
jgi:hypothetical protein